MKTLDGIYGLKVLVRGGMKSLAQLIVWAKEQCPIINYKILSFETEETGYLMCGWLGSCYLYRACLWETQWKLIFKEN